MNDVQKIQRLDQALKDFSSGLGYSEVRHRGKLLKYKVRTVVGNIEILVPGREASAQKELLKELENLVTYCQLKPFPEPKEPPFWLVPEAHAFCRSPKIGLHRFGKQIVIRGTRNGKPEEFMTRAQIIHVAPTANGGMSLDIFRYLPTERASYKTEMRFQAAKGWNYSMHYYIEKKGFPPSVARDTLSSTQREMIDAIADSLGPSTEDLQGEAGLEFLNVLFGIFRR